MVFGHTRRAATAASTIITSASFDGASTTPQSSDLSLPPSPQALPTHDHHIHPSHIDQATEAISILQQQPTPLGVQETRGAPKRVAKNKKDQATNREKRKVKKQDKENRKPFKKVARKSSVYSRASERRVALPPAILDFQTLPLGVILKYLDHYGLPHSADLTTQELASTAQEHFSHAKANDVDIVPCFLYKIQTDGWDVRVEPRTRVWKQKRGRWPK